MRTFLTTFLVVLAIALHGQTLISTGSSWSYLDDGSDQGTAWKDIYFDDSGWSTGNAILGYGDLNGTTPTTTVSYGSDANNKYITTYFRHSFSVDNPNTIDNLSIDLLVDDGAVIYLNGIEVVRDNLPTGTITYTTLAPNNTSGASENDYVTFGDIPAVYLRSGINVLAVEVHQELVTSSDLGLDLSLTSVAGPSEYLTRGPYLQIGTPTSQVVKWRTNTATDSKVFYGTSPDALSSSVTSAFSVTEHDLTITGLSPSTTYYYAVGNAAGQLAGGGETFKFKTSPVHGSSTPIKIWVHGDAGTDAYSGNDGTNQKATRDAYQNYAYTNGIETDWVMQLGDNAYSNGTDAQYQEAMFDMYSDVLKEMVFWSTPGNHDLYGGNNYYPIYTQPTSAEAGGLASGTESYFSFDYGNVHFISLNSYNEDRAVNGTMYNWLQNDLANTTQDWIIAFFHHPPYSKGSHDSDTETELVQMRTNFLPLLESNGVDLVLAGHSHSYERSY